MNKLTFRSILKDAVAVETKGQGVTAAFFNLARNSKEWAHIDPLIIEAETNHKASKGGPIPGVWRNAKSVIKAGFETMVDTADGKQVSVIHISETFNDLKVRLKTLKDAATAVEKLAKAEEKAAGVSEGGAEEKADSVPECLRHFVAACVADEDVLALIDADVLDDVFQQLKATAKAQSDAATAKALESSGVAVAH